MVQNQPRQIVKETLCKKHPSQKRAGGVQAPGPQKKRKRTWLELIPSTAGGKNGYCN
jgi:hypothetical protein